MRQKGTDLPIFAAVNLFDVKSGIFAISALLVLLYCAEIFDVVSWLSIEQHRHVQRMEISRTPSEQLEKLEFSLAEYEQIVWMETEEEFQYKGDFYDVSRIEKQDGKVILYCKNDSREKEMVQQYRALKKSQASQNLYKEKQQKLYDIAAPLPLSPLWVQTFNAFAEYNFPLTHSEQHSTSPPPELFV